MGTFMTKDIIIARIQFPNDPCKNKTPHQMFVAEYSGNAINLYSVSSILGKEKRVYGSEKERYVTILHPEHEMNNFSVPSFIDCSKMYRINISENTNIDNLSGRVISRNLKKRINAKISEMKAAGKHQTYIISEADFRSWNPKIR